jgi:hypothetical protein
MYRYQFTLSSSLLGETEIDFLVSDKTLQWKINYWAKKYGQEVVEFQPTIKGEASIGYVAVPQERFICPLTNEMMEDPVMTREGLNFEPKAILISGWTRKAISVQSHSSH